MNKKLALVGWAASSREQAPFDDPEYDVWGCNEMGMSHPHRFTAWFNTHEPNQIALENRQWLAQQGTQVYLREPLPEIPDAIVFPYKELMERFKTNYFTSTIAWQIALAIHKGYEQIEFYGIDMAMDTEYGYQKPCCEWWIGLAQGMGIKIGIANNSPMCKPLWVYGLEAQPETEGFITERMMYEMQRETGAKHNEAAKAAIRFEGQLDIINRIFGMIKHGKRDAGLPAFEPTVGGNGKATPAQTQDVAVKAPAG